MQRPHASGVLNRRQFLTAALATLAVPTIIPATALGRGGRPAASERITLAAVGWGGMGPHNTQAFLQMPDCQVVAVCDVDAQHLAAGVTAVNQHYQNRDCRGYADYRELLARPDIDAVMLALPDHWHALVAVEAARQGKDIYGEKPLARTIREQQAIVRAVQEHRRIWQTGSWQRSLANFRKACEIVRNGLIGRVTRVEVGLPAGHTGQMAPEDFQPRPPPPELDYDLWLGPAALVPYVPARIHRWWRWNYNTGGGQLLDWVGHHADIAHWGLGMDDNGPLTVEGQGEFPPADAVWNTCTRYRIEARYPQGVTMIIAGGHKDIRSGTKWIGTEGWVWVDRGGFEASDEAWSEMKELPDSLARIRLYRSTHHQRNFVDCVKTRRPTVTPVEVAHHSTIPGHLGLIAMMVGRKIQWDARREVIVNDPGAAALLGRVYRPPWRLTG